MLVKHHMPAYIKTFRRDVVAFLSRCNTPGIRRAENETVAWFDCMVEGRESKGSLRCEALYRKEVCGTAAERERLSCERSGFVFFATRLTTTKPIFTFIASLRALRKQARRQDLESKHKPTSVVSKLAF